MAAGQAVFGAVNGTGMIQSFPEAIDAAERKYPTQSARINSLTSGVFMGSMGLGQIIGFLYATATNDVLGFRYTCDIVSLVSFIVVIAYLIFGSGASAFVQTCHKCKQNTKEEPKDNTEPLIEVR